MKDPVMHKTWTQTEKTLVFNGFGFGSHYPVVVASVSGQALSKEQLDTLTQLLQEVLPGLEDDSVQPPLPDAKNRFRMSVEWLLKTLHLTQRAADLPVYECGRIISLEEDHARFFLPTVLKSVKQILDLLRTLLELMENQVQGKNPQKLLKKFAQCAAELKKTSPKGANIPFFIQAALDMGMPFQELPAHVLQYGQGKHGHWMQSSFSEKTPLISATVSRNKLAGAILLRRAGIPVPDHKIAPTIERAVRVADTFGYPVVIKPTDLDGGVGVAAGLQNREELVTAFKYAQKYSRNILVEKHFEGKDYRVTVFQNEVLSAVERVPGSVTGDGKHTVRELVEMLNADPLRGEGKHATLKKLMWNNEAIALLKHAGMDGSSVPELGEFVRLRRAANVASGGVPVGALEKMHPDNKLLAVRAARALRLDLAGIDILTPDIAKSWLETGAVICEVNGQPNLGHRSEEKDLFTPILNNLVPGNGRIPIAVILGDPSQGKLANNIEKRLLKEGIGTGNHTTEGVRINGEAVLEGEVDPFSAGQILTADKTVEAIVLSINDESVLSTGMPFARFDLLVLAGEHIDVPENAEKPDSGAVMQNLLELILPACDGKVVPVKGNKTPVEQYRHLCPADWEKPVAQSTAVKKITAAMLAHPGTAHPTTNGS